MDVCTAKSLVRDWLIGDAIATGVPKNCISIGSRSKNVVPSCEPLLRYKWMSNRTTGSMKESLRLHWKFFLRQSNCHSIKKRSRKNLQKISATTKEHISFAFCGFLDECSIHLFPWPLYRLNSVSINLFTERKRCNDDSLNYFDIFDSIQRSCSYSLIPADSAPATRCLFTWSKYLVRDNERKIYLYRYILVALLDRPEVIVDATNLPSQRVIISRGKCASHVQGFPAGPLISRNPNSPNIKQFFALKLLGIYARSIKCCFFLKDWVTNSFAANERQLHQFSKSFVFFVILKFEFQFGREH